MENAILPKCLFGKLMRVIGACGDNPGQIFAVPFSQENIFRPTCHFITCKWFFLSPQKKKKKMLYLKYQWREDLIKFIISFWATVRWIWQVINPCLMWETSFITKKPTDFPPSPFLFNTFVKGCNWDGSGPNAFQKHIEILLQVKRTFHNWSHVMLTISRTKIKDS